MATKRTYGDGCAAAHALDLIGERWALLIVRELLFGPKRFTDLRSGMPAASPNVLSERLHELEERGVVLRRRVGPPVAAWVYELTPWGRDLEPVLTHLGHWGRRSPFRDHSASTSSDAMMLALRGHFEARKPTGVRLTLSVALGDDRFVVRIGPRAIDISRTGAPPEAVSADAELTTDTSTFSAMLTGRLSVPEALEDGLARIDGDAAAVERFFTCLAPAGAQ